MKITKTQLRKMIKEELTQIKEGLHLEGFLDIMKDEIGRWHQEAKDSLRSDLIDSPLALEKGVLEILDELDGQEPRIPA